tara:strand:- start:373 stop:570 length:198 start_codon:yes stop_codon:yes gene_type:complete
VCLIQKFIEGRKLLWIITVDTNIGFGTVILLCGLLEKLVDLVLGCGICSMVEKKLKKVLDKCYPV